MTTAKKTAAKRPSLAKKTSRVERQKQDSLLDQGVRIVVGDEVYQVLAGDLNGLHARELRRQVGVTYPQLVAVLESEYIDVDMVAALIWLRRIVDGENVSYNQVASETGYDVLDEMEFGQVDTEPPAGDDSPED